MHFQIGCTCKRVYSVEGTCAFHSRLAIHLNGMEGGIHLSGICSNFLSQKKSKI